MNYNNNIIENTVSSQRDLHSDLSLETKDVNDYIVNNSLINDELKDKNNEPVLNTDEPTISFGLPDVLFTITLNSTFKTEAVNVLVCKMMIVRELQEVDLSEVSAALDVLKISNLNIISINNYDYTDKYCNISIESPSVINYVEVGKNAFINLIKDPNINFLEYNKNALYILRDGSYSDIKKIFTNINGFEVLVGKGGSQKSHIVSPLELRMHGYILALLNFNYKYMGYLNTFNDLAKERYLPLKPSIKRYNNIKDSSSTGVFSSVRQHETPSIHTKSRREYHTSSIVTEAKKESPVFSYLDEIEGIVKYSSSLYEAQKEIETSWISLMKKKLENPSVSSWRMLPELIKRGISTLEKYEKRGILKRRFKLFHSELSSNKYEVVLLTISMLVSNYNKMGATNISINIGSNIAFLLFKNTIEYEKISNLRGKFEDWKKAHDLSSNAKLLKLGDYYVNLFTNEPTQMFEFGLDEDDVIDTTSERIIKISPEYADVIKDSLVVHPTSLPMICEPGEWSDFNYGGFVENKYNKDPINTGSSYHGHSINNKESLYKAINTLNKIKFCVNRDLLNYIENEGNYLLEDEDSSSTKNYQNSITLKVANIYSKLKFYLNVNCDWRSRIYTNSFFLTYQGGDLSRSLIEFSDGKALSKEGLKYLYIFGANCYSDLLGKKSITQRIAWVKTNLTKITELDKKFINKANKKIQFAAFCITVKNYEVDNNYLVKLPIFLDATCSGIQHLAAMLQDINIGTHVNLSSKTEDDSVNDLYETVVEPLNEAINKIGKENPLYSSLSEVKLNRKIIKTPIMTQVYNVTVDGIYRQLIKKFKKERIISLTEKTEEGKPKWNTFYKVPTKNGKEVSISFTNVYKIAEITKNITFNTYPALKGIYSYFLDSVKLMLKLNIPIIWFTPAGLEICQHYYASEIKKVKLSYFGKTRTSVTREWKKTIIDKNKQNQAIVPNIIHSLDASHLINVINCGHSKNIYPIISIHDCFGTHPNVMESLANIVRSEFILLYTEHDFLSKYNERVINSIKDNNYEIVEKDGEKYVLFFAVRTKKDGTKTIANKGKLILIPSVPKMGDLDLKKIINAIYMIN